MTTERPGQSAPRSGPPEPPKLGLNLDPDTNYPSTRGPVRRLARFGML